MNREQRGVVKAVSVIAALLWVVLGLRFGWPFWVLLTLIVVTIAAPWLVIWRYRRWKVQRLALAPRPVETVEPPERPNPTERPLSGVPLRSAHPDYKFLFSGTVFWYSKPDAPGLPHVDPGGLAADLILEQARRLVAEVPPDEGELAEYRLNAALGAERCDPTGHVAVWAGEGGSNSRNRTRRDCGAWPRRESRGSSGSGPETTSATSGRTWPTKC